MKKTINRFYNNNFHIVIIILISLSLLLQASCKKDEAGPSISKVRPISPALAGDTITAAANATWIVIQGSNFATLKHIYINGYDNPFTTTYVTDNNIVVKIADGVPNLATNPDSAFNTLTLVTRYGQCTITFTTLPPAPVIDSISNEFANEGDVITLYGKYFYSSMVDSVIFPGSVKATVFTATDNGLTLSVTVPKVTSSGAISVHSASGYSSISSRGRGLFQDTVGIFLPFEDNNTINSLIAYSSGGGVTETNYASTAQIPDCRGNYGYAFYASIDIGNAYAQPFGSDTHASMLTYTSSIDLTTPADSLEVRFEVYVKSPWLGNGIYEMAFLHLDLDATTGASLGTYSWTDAYRYYFRPWFNSSTSWVTFSLPLSSFKMDANSSNEGATPSTYADVKGHAFDFDFKNASADAGGLVFNLNLAFDNFRIVKIH
jgi:hypothetical protein